MKRFLYLTAAFLLISFFSCKKEDQKNEFIQISGIMYKDVNGENIGFAGSPSDYSMTGNNDFALYPNPCRDILRFFVRNQQSGSVHYYVLPTEYKDAPETYSDGITTIDVKVENLDLDPNARLVDENITATSGNITVDINTENYKSGFYRLYTEWDGNERYINFWVVHP